MTQTQFNAMRISLRNRKALREFVREQKANLYAMPVVAPSAADKRLGIGQNPLLEGRGYLFDFSGLKRFCNWNDRSVPALRETA